MRPGSDEPRVSMAQVPLDSLMSVSDVSENCLFSGASEGSSKAQREWVFAEKDKV